MSDRQLLSRLDRPCRRRSATATLAAMAMIGLNVAGATTANATTTVPAAAAASPSLARFTSQPLTWHTCTTGTGDAEGGALDAAHAQCTTITVPLDYARPQGKTITLAISRLKATSTSTRRGVLMLNPGGPGEQALTEPLDIAHGAPTVAASYDLIGMDPRFVGRSTPLNCGWPTDLYLRSAGPTHRSFEQSATFEKSLADRCATTNAAVLPYAGTRYVAQDMDVVRAALGEQKLSYLGYSYGTYLGAEYLQMFPNRADRIVLDSAVDPTRPNVQGAALTAALEHWATWAAAHDNQYHLGASTAQVLATVESVDRAAAATPLTLGDFTITSELLPVILFVPLGDDHDATYAGLAATVQLLTAAAHGQKVTVPAELAQALTVIVSPESGVIGGSTMSAIFCADQPTSRHPQTYFRDIQAHRRTEPLFGQLIRNITPCAFWSAPAALPAPTIDNDVPALIVAATGDSHTPYPGQLIMHRELTGSRLLTLNGAYEHTVYLMNRSTALDQMVTHYLVDGALPTTDITINTTSPGAS